MKLDNGTIKRAVRPGAGGKYVVKTVSTKEIWKRLSGYPKDGVKKVLGVHVKALKASSNKQLKAAEELRHAVIMPSTSWVMPIFGRGPGKDTATPTFYRGDGGIVDPKDLKSDGMTYYGCNATKEAAEKKIVGLIANKLGEATEDAAKTPAATFRFTKGGHDGNAGGIQRVLSAGSSTEVSGIDVDAGAGNVVFLMPQKAAMWAEVFAREGTDTSVFTVAEKAAMWDAKTSDNRSK